MPGPLRDSMLPSPRQQLVTHGHPPLQLAVCTQSSYPRQSSLPRQPLTQGGY